MYRYLIGLCLLPALASAQSGFLRGADLSYVNEMENCGAVFSSGGDPSDPYALFAAAGCDMARLRLWHTPSWYDTLNTGQRYSDFEDVCRSAGRARAAGMEVLLDFHLSDFWADPGRQWIPAAWAPVADDLPVLSDSLYNYIYRTLLAMDGRGLLPDMVQIGNETNRGILLPPAVNDAGWVLDWGRNAPLFLSGLQAVADAEAATGSTIQTALHIAGPTNAAWLLEGFANHGVTDFDVIGLSYYWQWHQPTSIAQTGSIVADLRAAYPEKAVMIFETGYPWTHDYADPAANILTTVHPDYAPLSPAMQQQWMLDLTEAVMANGGSGVFYWEPAWVSTPCYTPWGQGSHKENAAFFDFEGEVLDNGGMAWFGAALSAEPARFAPPPGQVAITPQGNRLHILVRDAAGPLFCQMYGIDGRGLSRQPLQAGEQTIAFPDLPAGQYVAVVQSATRVFAARRVQWYATD